MELDINMRELVATTFRSLRRPGPPPPKWAKQAAVVVALMILFGIVLIERGLALHDNPGRYFGEGRPGTTVPVVLLLVSGVFCWLIAKDLRGQQSLEMGRGFRRFWLAFGGVFAYLAVDDMFKVHERIDPLLAQIFSLNAQSRLVDEIDSVIVAAYLPIVAILAWPHRERLVKTSWFLICMAVASLLFAAMVVFDMAGNMPAVEESFKLFAAVAITIGISAARKTYQLEHKLALIEHEQTGTD